jgi:hypothetical protein
MTANDCKQPVAQDYSKLIPFFKICKAEVIFLIPGQFSMQRRVEEQSIGQ